MTFPNLSSVKKVALDIETKDSDLLDLGPGPRRKGDYILGVGAAVKGKSWYFPLNHLDKENNVDKVKFFRWLKDLEGKTCIWANGSYDLDWLQYKKFCPKKNIDVLYAASLLDENHRHSLDSVAKKILGIGKAKSKPEQWAEEKGLKGDFRQHLWQMPVETVYDYGRMDTELTYMVWEKQEPELREQGLIPVFEMECDLMHYLTGMRKLGMRIDLKKLAALKRKYPKEINKRQAELDEIAGFPVNVGSSKNDLRLLFDKFNQPYPRTEKTNSPSFTSIFLENNEWEVAGKISNLKHLKKILSTYVTGFERFLVGDRVHCEFNQLRGDEYGTVTGRFSSSRPSLQVIPKKNEEFKKDLRGLFLPEEDCDLLRTDYKQEEVILLLHFATGPGSEDFRESYRGSPEMDFHTRCTELLGLDVKQYRKKVKSINLGLIYGMGLKKLCVQLGMSEERGKRFLAAHGNLFPFLKHTFYDALQAGQRNGFVKTIMGRRRRFPDPSFAYKSLNSVIQGSAADIMKASMLKAYKDGVFDVLKLQLLVHDEFVCSMPRTKAGWEAAKEFIHIQENIFPLSVPLTVEVETGKNWGDMKEWKR